MPFNTLSPQQSKKSDPQVVITPDPTEGTVEKLTSGGYLPSPLTPIQPGFSLGPILQRIQAFTSPISTKLKPEVLLAASPSEPSGQDRLAPKDKKGKKRASTEVLADSLLSTAVEVIPDRLYFDCVRSYPLTTIDDVHMFSIDDQFQYIHFYMDFGPPNIGQIYRFCKLMNEKINDQAFRNKKLLMVTAQTTDKCTNAAFLICSYLVVEHGLLPEQAVAPFRAKQSTFPFAPYRDAGYGPATYWIDILDCMKALHRGLYQDKLFSFENFDLEQYEFYEKVENGDLNWIIPGYFLAMATPNDTPAPHLLRYHEQVRYGEIIPAKPVSKRFKPLLHLHDLCDYLKSPDMNVKAIVRLNNKLYEREHVLERGLEHYELFFPDGSVPKFDSIVRRFMDICDTHLPPWPPVETRTPNAGGLAIHCKAGLGRTGTLICCWMIKNLGWTARSCIAWCRLMRPGSVVGPQQNWLETMEPALLKWGETERAEKQKLTLMAEVKLARSADKLKDKALEVNDGSDKLAEDALGFKVPVQPNKLERNQSEEKGYRLRSLDMPGKAAKRKTNVERS